MNQITLQCDGRLEHGGQTIQHKAWGYLNHSLQLGSAVTFRSYFNLLGRYPQFSQLNAFCSTCWTQYEACPETGCRTDAIDRLEFFKSIEMVGFPGAPRLEIFTSFKGIKNHELINIEGLAWESILDMPVQLGCLKHVVFGDRVDAFEFETAYTLFEFVDGMAWELSFQNRPQICQLRR
jgi:hypothetical protein